MLTTEHTENTEKTKKEICVGWVEWHKTLKPKQHPDAIQPTITNTMDRFRLNHFHPFIQNILIHGTLNRGENDGKHLPKNKGISIIHPTRRDYHDFSEDSACCDTLYLQHFNEYEDL